MDENLCGLCKANGLKKQLILFQLNLEEAILLCENKECVYPLGVTGNASLIVRRQASEVGNFKRKRKKKNKQREIEEPENGLVYRCLESYLHWQNVNSLCWLHSVMSLVVHNVTLSSLALNVDSLLRTVADSFHRAQELSLTNREQAVRGLQDAREEVWKYLQPRMKCEHGVCDSPVTALPLLLQENCTLSEKTLQIYQWEFSCNACGYQQIDKRRKHLVTYPNVPEGFSLQDPAFLRPCYRCGASNQRSKLVYDRMPQCVFLHFEQGLKQATFQDLEFQRENDHYIMTQFIQYKRNPDHFVCWTREPKGKRWMEMDDLKSPVCSWSSFLPAIPPSQVHIAVWEKVGAVHALPLYPVTKKIAKANIQDKPVGDIKMDGSVPKISLSPLLNIDCNMSSTMCDDVNRGLLSPTSSAPTFLPPSSVRSRTLLHGSSQQKLGAGRFEPYIPRKKRLVNYSCPNSPLCTKSDPDKNTTPVSSPVLSQSFLTWQDIKEQNKKVNPDDLQSDSGYSSPLSVSSCGSLPTGQSSHGDLVSDCLEDLHVHSNEKQVVDTGLSPRDCSLFDANTDSDLLQVATKHDISTMDSCRSADLANKLEDLLPDCLMECPKSVVNRGAVNNGRELKLTDVGKLSEEQDQFIRDLLAE